MIEYFNTKYKNYLEKGHYGLDIDNPAVISFLDELFENYLIKIEGFSYSQIKMKYNFARFYFSINSETVDYTVIETIEFLVENTINILMAKYDD